MNHFQQQLAVTAIMAAAMTASPMMGQAQQPARHLPPGQIVIDEDILIALVDEPCHHFEVARREFVAGQFKAAADHLRTASAFLRLEAARAVPEGKGALDASIGELRRLAVEVEYNQVGTVDVLQQAFARAHFALAAHHCVKSAHRCCQPNAFNNSREMTRAGYDLQAATVHLKRGLLWTGGRSAKVTQQRMDAAELAAEELIQTGNAPRKEVGGAIRSLRVRLEKLTGRRIMLASPLVDDELFGSSVTVTR